jgi:hypothetical protein
MLPIMVSGLEMRSGVVNVSLMPTPTTSSRAVEYGRSHVRVGEADTANGTWDKAGGESAVGVDSEKVTAKLGFAVAPTVKFETVQVMVLPE